VARGRIACASLGGCTVTDGEDRPHAAPGQGPTSTARFRGLLAPAWAPCGRNVGANRQGGAHIGRHRPVPHHAAYLPKRQRSSALTTWRHVLDLARNEKVVGSIPTGGSHSSSGFTLRGRPLRRLRGHVGAKRAQRAPARSSRRERASLRHRPPADRRRAEDGCGHPPGPSCGPCACSPRRRTAPDGRGGPQDGARPGWREPGGSWSRPGGGPSASRSAGQVVT
jgi:hypothetical protein